MKPYFSKLLTEVERAGHRNLSRKWGGKVKYNPDPEFDYEDEINFVSMARCGRQYGYNCKTFGDVLNPLYGYLEKNVGRHWDDVYSEIAQGIDRRSLTGMHLYTHLWQMVERNTVMCEDGKVREFNAYAGWIEPSNFYIHPYTRILCVADYYYHQTRHRKEEKESNNILSWQHSDGLVGCSYWKVDGIWYCVRWKWDVIINGQPSIYNKPWTQMDKLTVTWKKQLSKKELKGKGLKNI